MLFLKFILVGIINTLFGYCFWAFLIFIKVHYALAVVISTIAGILFNFKTTGTIVFHNKNNKLLLKFVLIYLIIMLLNIIGLKVSQISGYNLYVAGFVLTGFMAVISFLLQKYYVFRGSNYEKN